MDETFSSIDYVAQCLLDRERTTAFSQAITEVITPDSVVLDSGTGSGILAMFAARAGAKKVISFEIDPYVAKIATENIRRNNLSHIIEVINADIRKYKFSEGFTFDVVLMEMLTTGMVDEYQIWAVNQLHSRNVVTKDTVFIPGKQETYIATAYTDFDVDGFDMKMPIHTWSWLTCDDRVDLMSPQILLHSADFTEKNAHELVSEITFKAERTGKINSIYLTSVSILSAHVSVKDTLALNGPVVVPLDEDIEVTEGEEIMLAVRYSFGNGYRNFHITRV